MFCSRANRLPQSQSRKHSTQHGDGKQIPPQFGHIHRFPFTLFLTLSTSPFHPLKFRCLTGVTTLRRATRFRVQPRVIGISLHHRGFFGLGRAYRFWRNLRGVHATDSTGLATVREQRAHFPLLGERIKSDPCRFHVVRIQRVQPVEHQFRAGVWPLHVAHPA